MNLVNMQHKLLLLLRTLVLIVTIINKVLLVIVCMTVCFFLPWVDL